MEKYVTNMRNPYHHMIFIKFLTFILGGVARNWVIKEPSYSTRLKGLSTARDFWGFRVNEGMMNTMIPNQRKVVAWQHSIQAHVGG